MCLTRLKLRFKPRKVVGITDFNRESFLEKTFNFLPPFQQTALALSLLKREGDRGSNSGYHPLRVYEIHQFDRFSRKEVIHPQLRLGIPCSCFSTHYLGHGLYLHPPKFRRCRRIMEVCSPDCLVPSISVSTGSDVTSDFPRYYPLIFRVTRKLPEVKIGLHRFQTDFSGKLLYQVAWTYCPDDLSFIAGFTFPRLPTRFGRPQLCCLDGR